ncbi:BspA family leucine-rich repeat surface protein [Mycoplasma mycoides subsp. capri]|nr:BspA family leucine-rich repeat surface protein [Mycoplasma mycoides subsp. capri]SRX61062.1 BspA family leucine-rich repeat surface protein [Mycoplasma mycoides subsp. capri]SRX61305.1 BspA family leucine-rich repeat surface protein [Mycoplasma mycoides subsp. capri]SRX62689.1 BspA family leucine-rich repeat surface protein [Mycoplasma mycoides subsp. capri]SRX62941.1 BspA family leucine-rich repeat surface protein [Mycoplasma mycoides subsp. capri]
MFYDASAFEKDLSNWNVSKDPFQVNFAKYSSFENKKNLWPKFKNKD